MTPVAELQMLPFCLYNAVYGPMARCSGEIILLRYRVSVNMQRPKGSALMPKKLQVSKQATVCFALENILNQRVWTPEVRRHSALQGLQAQQGQLFWIGNWTVGGSLWDVSPVYNVRCASTQLTSWVEMSRIVRAFAEIIEKCYYRDGVRAPFWICKILIFRHVAILWIEICICTAYLIKTGWSAAEI